MTWQVMACGNRMLLYEGVKVLIEQLVLKNNNKGTETLAINWNLHEKIDNLVS